MLGLLIGLVNGLQGLGTLDGLFFSVDFDEGPVGVIVVCVMVVFVLGVVGLGVQSGRTFERGGRLGGREFEDFFHAFAIGFFFQPV